MPTEEMVQTVTLENGGQPPQRGNSVSWRWLPSRMKKLTKDSIGDCVVIVGLGIEDVHAIFEDPTTSDVMRWNVLNC